MPDENKFAALREAGYAIRSCCLLCEHGDFPVHGMFWGHCKKITYTHKKHTQKARPLGIHILGLCFDFKAGSEAQVGQALDSYATFSDPQD